MHPTRVVVLLASALTAACSTSRGGSDGGDPVPCAAGFLGDGGTPSIEVTALQPDGAVTPVADGGPVPLMFPPQGGRVVFVGVRATNVEACGLQLTGALRDLSTQEVRVDARTVELSPTGDGAGVSGTSGQAVAANFANVPVCPNEWSPSDIDGTRYGLEVTLVDPKGRKASAKLAVVPQCAEPARRAECACICQGGYVLGESCDGGTDP